MASAYQRSGSAQRSNSGYGSREAEANASLMEEGNNAKWVRKLLALVGVFFLNYASG